MSVVIRELGSGRVIYETNASNEQRWFDPDTVFPPMFEAAVDATEEAVLDSLFPAATTLGRFGRVAEALPIDEMLELM